MKKWKYRPDQLLLEQFWPYWELYVDYQFCFWTIRSQVKEKKEKKLNSKKIIFQGYVKETKIMMASVLFFHAFFDILLIVGAAKNVKALLIPWLGLAFLGQILTGLNIFFNFVLPNIIAGSIYLALMSVPIGIVLKNLKKLEF